MKTFFDNIITRVVGGIILFLLTLVAIKFWMSWYSRPPLYDIPFDPNDYERYDLVTQLYYEGLYFPYCLPVYVVLSIMVFVIDAYILFKISWQSKEKLSAEYKWRMDMHYDAKSDPTSNKTVFCDYMCKKYRMNYDEENLPNNYPNTSTLFGAYHMLCNAYPYKEELYKSEQEYWESMEERIVDSIFQTSLTDNIIRIVSATSLIFLVVLFIFLVVFLIAFGPILIGVVIWLFFLIFGQLTGKGK